MMYEVSVFSNEGKIIFMFDTEDYDAATDKIVEIIYSKTGKFVQLNNNKHKTTTYWDII
jgi:hypothetical protein